MGSLERILGKLEEHKEATEKRLDRIETKVDSLLKFKWQIVGSSAVVSAVIAACLEYLKTRN